MTFASLALVPARAERFFCLASSEKGRRKLLAALDHDLERAIRPTRNRTDCIDRRSPCYAFHSSTGFGKRFASVADAYSDLSLMGGWLIVLTDGSAGIYRPEAHWDAEREISG